MSAADTRSDREGLRCRLEIAGCVSANWADWFEADSVTPAGDDTILELRVAGMIIAFTTLSMAAAPIHAQGRWELEVRGHSAVVTQDGTRDRHENGSGFRH